MPKLEFNKASGYQNERHKIKHDTITAALARIKKTAGYAEYSTLVINH
jgi:hypothetical protein